MCSISVLFQFSVFHLNDAVVLFGLGFVGWFEVLKLVRPRGEPAAKQSKSGLGGACQTHCNFARADRVTIFSNEHAGHGLIMRVRSRFPILDAWIARTQAKATGVLENTNEKRMP